MVVREDRKELILDKAVGIFAEKGFYKATTAMVAAAAGVTQPYVFHFFKNKEELFNAVVDRAVIRIRDTFSQVDAPADRLHHSLGHAFVHIMDAHRDEILLVMQAHAISEPAIRGHVRERFRLIHEAIVAKFANAGITNAAEAASQFIGTGFLITVSEVLQLPQLLWFDPKDKNSETEC